MPKKIMNTLDALLRDSLPASVLAKPLTEVWVAIRTDGLPDDITDPQHPVVVVIGDGTRDNPWDGSTALKLDRVLSFNLKNVSNVTIHLGPGVFRTGGGGGVNLYSKWLPLSGGGSSGAVSFRLRFFLQRMDSNQFRMRTTIIK